MVPRPLPAAPLVVRRWYLVVPPRPLPRFASRDFGRGLAQARNFFSMGQISFRYFAKKKGLKSYFLYPPAPCPPPGPFTFFHM
jgi:hypothetical protein